MIKRIGYSKDGLCLVFTMRCKKCKSTDLIVVKNDEKTAELKCGKCEEENKLKIEQDWKIN